jgi:hypothetical protein
MMVYLAISTTSLVILLACAIRLLYSGQARPAELTGLFGSSGLITYSTGRLLFMWSQALRWIAGEKSSEEN